MLEGIQIIIDRTRHEKTLPVARCQLQNVEGKLGLARRRIQF